MTDTDNANPPERPANTLAAGHGSRSAYQHGCRCALCREANAHYAGVRYLCRRLGQTGLVDATPARRHLRKLQRRGVGKRQAARLAHLSLWVVAAVRSGRVRWIRAATARRLLAIPAALALGSAVEAQATRRLISRLIAEGVDAESIAARVGDVHHQRVRVRTALRVRRLHRLVTTGGT